MDEDKTTVTMPLKDFDELRSYKKAYKELISAIRRVAFIDAMTTNEITVVIKKQAAQDFLVPFAADDCELESYPDGVIVNWK